MSFIHTLSLLLGRSTTHENMPIDLSPLIWYEELCPYMGVICYHVTLSLLSEGHMIANHPIYGVIGYHVTLSEGHMIANHPI